MSISEWMNTLPSSSYASQFGSQAWLIQRASLPWLPPSITLPSARLKKKVWLTGPSLASARRSASGQSMRSPVYSMMHSPASILRVAKTPLPCTGDSLTLHGGDACLDLLFIVQ